MSTGSRLTVTAGLLAPVLAVMAFMATVAGCNSPSSSKPADRVEPAQGDTGAPPPAIDEARGAGTDGADGKPECTDWSTLDRDALPALVQTPYTETFDRVWDLVRTKHYDATLGCVDWPAKRLEHGKRLEGAADLAAAYEIMNDLLHELGQSHFGIIPPDDRVPDDPDAGPARPRIQVRWIEERLTVVASQDPGIPMGAILEAVNGKALDDVIDTAKSAGKRPADLAFKIGRGVDGRLACREGGSHKLRFLDPGRGDRSVQRPADCELPGGELITLGNLRNMPTRVTHQMIEGTKVGHLAFNIWMLPMVKRVQASMAELRGAGMTGLVLDLRGNPGGVGPMSVPIARMLLKDGGNLGKLQFREFANEFNVGPNPDPFEGPVVILVDEGTASTSEIFAEGMRDLGRVKILGGGPSAGAALPSLIEELQGGAILQYVVGDYHSPGGTVVEGVGVIPDTVVPERREDFSAGKDPVLDAAVALLATAQE